VPAYERLLTPTKRPACVLGASQCLVSLNRQWIVRQTLAIYPTGRSLLKRLRNCYRYQG